MEKDDLYNVDIIEKAYILFYIYKFFFRLCQRAKSLSDNLSRFLSMATYVGRWRYFSVLPDMTQDNF